MLRPRRLVIDTDIGVDDAVALVLALLTPSIAVAAITTVAGNTDVDQCVRNARYLTQICDADVPVYRGAEGPVGATGRRRPPVHGEDGLGDRGLLPAMSSPDDGVACERLIELAGAYPGELTLVTLGPLTNLALALRRAPEIARLYRRLVLMGGAITQGEAEFNIRSDPAAASAVFASGLPITLVPIELSQGVAALTAADLAEVAQIGTAVSGFVQAMCDTALQRSGSQVAGLPDAIAMAIAIEPSLVTRSHECGLDVENSGALHSVNSASHPLVAQVVDEIDADRYKMMIQETCR
jgi:purine nucleosidase